jgi:hypothetical protein
MQLSPESGKVRSPLPDPIKIAGSGRIDPAESIQIRLDLSHFGQIRADQWLDPSKSGRILAILARSGLLLTMAGFEPNSAGIWSAGIQRR